jgi:hypothetical protein
MRSCWNQGARRVAPWIGVLGLTLVGCSGASNSMPDALYGTWVGGNNLVSTVRFSDGGRIDINDGQCVGEYGVTSFDTNIADISTGYIRCPLMDGYLLDVTATRTDDTLTITGSLINGTYEAE